MVDKIDCAGEKVSAFKKLVRIVIWKSPKTRTKNMIASKKNKMGGDGKYALIIGIISKSIQSKNSRALRLGPNTEYTNLLLLYTCSSIFILYRNAGSSL